MTKRTSCSLGIVDADELRRRRGGAKRGFAIAGAFARRTAAQQAEIAAKGASEGKRKLEI